MSSEAVKAGDSTYFPNGGANPLAIFGKYGLHGLVIAVLLYFSWWNMNKVSGVVEKNTAAWSDNTGAMIQMKDALKDNTHAIQEMRRERMERRTR